MTYKQAVKQFREEYHYLYETQVDYWTGQQAWAGFVDYLNKDGQITDKQVFSWPTPFPYGKRLGVRYVYTSLMNA